MDGRVNRKSGQSRTLEKIDDTRDPFATLLCGERGDLLMRSNGQNGVTWGPRSSET